MSLVEYNQFVRKVAFSKQLKAVVEGLRNYRRSHPANCKSLQEFTHSLEESRPRKKQHMDTAKTGRKVDELLERHFKVGRRDFENLMVQLHNDGKKARYKNM